MRHMKVQYERLETLLRPAGFGEWLPGPEIPSFALVRKSAIRDLYESVVVCAGGQHAEAVDAGVGVSITRLVLYKWGGDVRVVHEVAEDKERAQTVITTDQKAIAWERKLVEVAPALCASWAQEKGPEILDRTREIRAIADEYWRHIDANCGREQLLLEMQSAMDAASLERADRLYDWPGIRSVYGMESAYRLACMAVVRYARVVERENPSIVMCDPLKELGLMHRIKLLADRFAFDVEPACFAVA